MSVFWVVPHFVKKVKARKKLETLKKVKARKAHKKMMTRKARVKIKACKVR